MQQVRFQLPLPFQHQPRFDADDFIRACSNQAALAWLRDRLAGAAAGAVGSGRLRQDPPAAYLGAADGRDLAVGPGADRSRWLPRMGLWRWTMPTWSATRPCCSSPERRADRHLRVLLSGRTAPARWPVRLPDLSSRLRAITAVEIGPPDDRSAGALLIRLLADRQLRGQSDAVQEWLLLRLPRSPAVLREAVARLDRASLVSRERISAAACGSRCWTKFPLWSAGNRSASGAAPSSSAAPLPVR